MEIENPNIFKEYDIRGIVETDFSDSLIIALGRAFGSYVIDKTGKTPIQIGVGRDVRLSSPRLNSLLTQGLLQTGAQVVNLGICPTPVTYFSLFHLPLDGAVMITGSHNPREYNGFKLCFNKTTLFGVQIQEIRKIIETDGFHSGEGKLSEYPILEAYQNYMMKRHAPLQVGKPLKIAVDPGNGTAALVVPALLKHLGCQVIELNCSLDGNFPNHHPDPTVAENLQELIDVVRREHADLGMAYDGDSDRLGLIDETGKILWGDEIMVILARDILKRNPGAVVIGEVKCSQRMYDALNLAGARAIMWKTGHSLIKNKMKEEKALLAGEMSGHIFLAENYFGFDDAVHSSMEIVRILHDHIEGGGTRISELLSDLPKAFSTPEIRVGCSDENKFDIVIKVRELLENHKKEKAAPLILDIISIDGVRAVFEEGWGLVRASNTQPILVSRYEGRSNCAMESYRDFFSRILLIATNNQLKGMIL